MQYNSKNKLGPTETPDGKMTKSPDRKTHNDFWSLEQPYAITMLPYSKLSSCPLRFLLKVTSIKMHFSLCIYFENTAFRRERKDHTVP